MERQIRYADSARRDIKSLSKKRHGFASDLASFESEFAGRRLPGDAVQGLGGLPVKEHRMRDSSSSRGKSGGFRVYYQYDDMRILVVAIFLRSEIPRSVTRYIRGIIQFSDFLDL